MKIVIGKPRVELQGVLKEGYSKKQFIWDGNTKNGVVGSAKSLNLNIDYTININKNKTRRTYVYNLY